MKYPDTRPTNSYESAVMLAKIAYDKKADNIVILNLTAIEFAPADFFVICSCDSGNQIDAIITETKKYCNEYFLDYPNIEGMNNSYWVIADFFDAVFHVMNRDARSYYRIEDIWADASFERINELGEVQPFTDLDYLKITE